VVTVFAGTNSANFYNKDPTRGESWYYCIQWRAGPGKQTETIK
jgi:hypothetical protein